MRKFFRWFTAADVREASAAERAQEEAEWAEREEAHVETMAELHASTEAALASIEVSFRAIARRRGIVDDDEYEAWREKCAADVDHRLALMDRADFKVVGDDDTEKSIRAGRDTAAEASWAVTEQRLHRRIARLKAAKRRSQIHVLPDDPGPQAS